jgi:hypothetical protein
LFSKPRGIQAARQLRLHRKSQRWADKKYNKVNNKQKRSGRTTDAEKAAAANSARHAAIVQRQRTVQQRRRQRRAVFIPRFAARDCHFFQCHDDAASAVRD